MARTHYKSLGINAIGDNDADIELTFRRYDPITEVERDAIVNPLNGMKIYNSDTNTIQGYANGAWLVPTGESIVIAHEDAWIQTRTQGTFVNDGLNDGTVMSPLDTVITPSKAGNKVVIEFVIFGEPLNLEESGFVISRNGVLLPNTTDGSNNAYAVNAVDSFDGNSGSTPQVTIVRLIDENTLNIESTYRILFRRTRAAPLANNSFFLNRSVDSPADNKETGVSTSKCIEYVI